MLVSEELWNHAEAVVRSPSALKGSGQSSSWSPDSGSTKNCGHLDLASLSPVPKRRSHPDLLCFGASTAINKRVRKAKETLLVESLIPHHHIRPLQPWRMPPEVDRTEYCSRLKSEDCETSVSSAKRISACDKELVEETSGRKWPPEESSCIEDVVESGNNLDRSRGWSFEVLNSLGCRPSAQTCDIITAIDFDETGSHFATGGIARKIRIFSYSDVIEETSSNVIDTDEREVFEEQNDNQHERHSSQSIRNCRKLRNLGKQVFGHHRASLKVICTPAKLSSLKWRPLSSNVVGCGDYDGTFAEWDVEHGLSVVERFEHSGERVWSVDYSSWFPCLCASASGDGTVRLWTASSERSVGIIRSPGGNSFCSAEFSSDGPHLVAAACADANVYLYDMRRLDDSILCLQQHDRAVSYVRFLARSQLVSASIDSTVKLWDVSADASTLPAGNTIADSSPVLRPGAGHLLRTFDSHVNVRNFSGLSVLRKDRLIACGSESNEVFVYETSRKQPVGQIRLPPSVSEHSWRDVDPGRGGCGAFVGAVCFREQGDHYSLIAGNSEGTLQIIKVTPPSQPVSSYSERNSSC